MLQRLKAQVGNVQINELYTLTLIAVGIPAAVWMYLDLKAALVVALLIQITLGIIRERE